MLDIFPHFTFQFKSIQHLLQMHLASWGVLSVTQSYKDIKVAYQHYFLCPRAQHSGEVSLVFVSRAIGSPTLANQKQCKTATILHKMQIRIALYFKKKNENE